MPLYTLIFVCIGFLVIGAPLASRPGMGPDKIIGICFVGVCAILALYVVFGLMNQTMAI
ncbi:MAG: hypothetical protein JO202_01665 [Ktedonobacteraceae bacterium]|nr:hypothetical protein [Ktedonobacteraceae bacterium]